MEIDSSIKRLQLTYSVFENLPELRTREHKGKTTDGTCASELKLHLLLGKIASA